jgi:alpha-tubulin suppressor-like RCC1 family protein
MIPLSKKTTILMALIPISSAAVWVQAQTQSLTLTPSNPVILAGQTQQLTANGTLTPKAVAGGGYHTCLLAPDGTIRCAGANSWGQLGNGSFTNSSSPVPVTGITTALTVGTGIEHTCSLVADGTIRCWGTSYVGQLGDGTIGSLSEVPKQVQGITGAIGLAVGGFHNCALLSDRTVKCWGRNQDGQVGNGDNTTDVSAPALPVAGLASVAAIAAGGYHSCALMPNSTVQCWGRNTRGQLGDGSSSFWSSTPVAVSGMTAAVSVSGGFYHTCALLRDGTVQCWGENDSGQIGNTLAYSNVPVTVSGIANAVAVSAGAFHSCALLSNGTVQCWGRNGNGQLGNGATVNSSSPVVVGGISGATYLGAGGNHTCALMPDRSGRCWGWNVYGQLASGNAVDSAVPVKMVGSGVTWTSSNPAAATVASAGLATGVGRGVTTVTATDSAGNAASTTLTVRTLERLTVTKSGIGSGTVTSNPSGINCGSTCSGTYLDGTVVTLKAVPGTLSVFTGWTGCDAVAGDTCTVAMSATKSVTADFLGVPVN